MDLANAVLLLGLATTLPLVGLIWLVQIVVYPQFARVGADEFNGYHRAHGDLITWVVGPLMLGELVAALARLWHPTPALTPTLAWLSLGLVLVPWVVTATASVPCHTRLSQGFDVRVQRRLVVTNWLRTSSWTAHGAVTLWVAWRQFP